MGSSRNLLDDDLFTESERQASIDALTEAVEHAGSAAMVEVGTKDLAAALEYIKAMEGVDDNDE